MLLFKDYFSFKKENKLLLKLVNDTLSYNIDLNPVIYILDLLSELREDQKDDELDFNNVINIFEAGFGYLKIYLNYINMFIMEQDFSIATEMADYISYYIEVSNYRSFLHNEYSDKKLKGLSDLDDYCDIVEDIITSRGKPDLDEMRKTLVRLLDIIENLNNIEIPTEDILVSGAFQILYEEIENDEQFDF